MILAQAGYNAVFEVTLAIVGVDIVLRLLVVEKVAATTEHARSDEDRDDQIQPDDSEKSRTSSMVADEEQDVENHLVMIKAG